MTVEKLIEQLPNTTVVMGPDWLLAKREWAQDFISRRLPWFEQLENDLTVLKAYVGNQKLTACYRDPLRNRWEIQETMFEAHGAALLGAAGTRLDLHVPRGDGSDKNFDVLVEICGCALNADSKTRKDRFPLNLPPRMADSAGLTLHEGIWTTLDPHDAADLGIDQGPEIPSIRQVSTPESTVIRQILLTGLEQLPERGCNVILFGQVEGIRYNLEDALYGTQHDYEHLDPKSGRARLGTMRYPTGAFSPGVVGDAFRPLSGVLWLELKGASVLERDYRLFLNPNALDPIPTCVVCAIRRVMDSLSTPLQEQDPSIDELPPEARRLFGLE